MSRAGGGKPALHRLFLVLIALAAASWPTEILAGTTALEGIAGWEGDSHGQGYGFAGIGWLVPAGPRLVVPLRAFGSYLYYDFESSGAVTRVRSPGVTMMAGIRFPGTRGNLTLMAGGETRQEHRTAEAQTISGIVLQADGDRAFNPRWRGYLFVNYGGASRYLYSRTAMRRQVSNLDWKRPTAFFLGLELIGQGNDETRAAQGGAFAEWNLVRQSASLALHGGYKESWSPGENYRRGGYLGLTLYRRF